MSTQRKVVGVVEDNCGIRRAMGRLLSLLGYETELYATPDEFLAAADRSEAICLVVDVELAESCGFEFAQRLLRAGSTTPIIFMSADDADPCKRRAAEIGCVAFLSKPFSAAVLIEALARIPRLRPPPPEGEK